MKKAKFIDIENELTGLSSPGIVPGLERLLVLLPCLGNPQSSFPAVHVVGTNGKGSTCATLAAILMESGYKVALYTSPHLVSFGERLRINGTDVPADKWYGVVEKIKTALGSCPGLKNNSPTYFELTTAAAFMIIAEERVDVAIIEAGLGGQYDATNTLEKIILTLIAPIGMDHMEYLGDDLYSIAREKFAVMREGVPAIFSSGGELEAEFREKAPERGAPGFLLRDICAAADIKTSLSGTDFVLDRNMPLRLHTPLTGIFQADNAALAVCGAYILAEKYSNITDETIIAGVAKTSWPGRFEIIGQNPTTIVDGAHNPHAMKRLAETLLSITERGSLNIVLAMMKDKDVRGVLALLRPLEAVIYCTQVPCAPRSMEAAELHALAKEQGLISACFCAYPLDALKAARMTGRTTICCGSLFLAGYLKGHINELSGV